MAKSPEIDWTAQFVALRYRLDGMLTAMGPRLEVVAALQVFLDELERIAQTPADAPRPPRKTDG